MCALDLLQEHAEVATLRLAPYVIAFDQQSRNYRIVKFSSGSEVAMATPLEFDQAIADEICERLASGQSLRKICGSERDDFMPGQTTVYRWLDENEDFAKQYASARVRQADSKFDEAGEIAEKATAENVQVARLQIDTIKWQAGKLAPKKYGEKVELEHSGKVKVTAIQLIGPDDDSAD